MDFPYLQDAGHDAGGLTSGVVRGPVEALVRPRPHHAVTHVTPSPGRVHQKAKRKSLGHLADRGVEIRYLPSIF